MPLDLHAAAALTPGVCTPQMYIGFGKSATCKLVDVANGIHEFEMMDLMVSILDAKPPRIPMVNDDPPLPTVARALQARNQRYTAKHGCAKADVNTNLWMVAPEACRTFPDATFLMIWRNVYEWAESQVTENMKSVGDGSVVVADAPPREPGSLLDKVSRTWPAEGTI